MIRNAPVRREVTPLERTAMEALAAELGGVAPDLQRQFQASRVTVRKNTGFGLFTELASRGRMDAQGREGPTGDFGSVHVMVAGLRDPVAFTVRLMNGRLVGLMGDSYGQDTRQIDFNTVAYNQVFTVDDGGRSVAFQSRHPRPSDARTFTAPKSGPHHEARRSAPATSVPASRGPAPAPAMSRTPAPAPAPSRPGPATPATTQQILKDVMRGFPRPDAQPRTPLAGGLDMTPEEQTGSDDRTSFLIGVYAVLAVIGVLLWIVFDIHPIFVIILGFWLSRYLRKPANVDALRQGFSQVQQAGRAMQDARRP